MGIFVWLIAFVLMVGMIAERSKEKTFILCIAYIASIVAAMMY